MDETGTFLVAGAMTATDSVVRFLDVWWRIKNCSKPTLVLGKNNGEEPVLTE